MNVSVWTNSQDAGFIYPELDPEGAWGLPELQARHVTLAAMRARPTWGSWHHSPLMCCDMLFRQTAALSCLGWLGLGCRAVLHASVHLHGCRMHHAAILACCCALLEGCNLLRPGPARMHAAARRAHRPERRCGVRALQARPDFAIALSGGGYRASTLSLGWVRALYQQVRAVRARCARPLAIGAAE